VSPGLRTYYLLLITGTISQVGSLISAVSISIAVFRATGHATPLTLVEFFSAVPIVAFGGFAGALADRFDRRLLMLIAQAGFVLCSGLMLWSFASGAFRLWHLYSLSFASAIFTTLQAPAFRASVVMLVPEAGRDRANAFAQMTGPAARAVALAGAGFLYVAIGVVGSILLDIATFLIASAALAIVRIPQPAETDEGRAFRGSIWRQTFDGFRYLAARPPLLGLCLYYGAANFVLGVALILGTPYFLARTGSEVLFGFVFSALNLGALAGALTMSVWGGTRPRINTVLPGMIVGGVSVALGGVARNAPELAAGFFVFTFTIPITNAATIGIFQAKVAPDLQGRVFAAFSQINGVSPPISFLIAGPLADQVFEPARRLQTWRLVSWAVGTGPGAGMGLMFVIAGLTATLFSLAVYAIPAIRRLETTLPDFQTTTPTSP